MQQLLLDRGCEIFGKTVGFGLVGGRFTDVESVKTCRRILGVGVNDPGGTSIRNDIHEGANS